MVDVVVVAVVTLHWTQMPKNETRIAAEHALFISEARLNRVIKVDNKIYKHKWALSKEEWDSHSGFEGVLHITQLASTQAQYEKLFLGAYSPMIKAVTLKRLRGSEIPVIKYEKMTESAKLERVPKDVLDFTVTGRKCLERARLEGERRFCGNKTEMVQGNNLPVTFSDSELLATLLDIRTAHCKHLTKDQRKKAMKIYEEEYVKYYRCAERFERGIFQQKKTPETQDTEETPNAPAPALQPAHKNADSHSSATTAYMSAKDDNTWSSDDSEDEEDSTSVEMTDDEIIEIAKQVHKNFRKVKIDWRAEYPHAKLTPEPGELDIFTDLMNLNPGEIYKKLESSDPERSKYGLISRMASGSKGCISFLPAASFCERVNSAAKDVMTDAHLLMNDDALEMMVILRINREFMEFMREKHNDLSLQQFGKTVVELMEGNNDASA